MNKNLLAYQLLARLKLLTLVGYENGEYVWMGKHSDFSKIPFEEERTKREMTIKNSIFLNREKLEKLLDNPAGDFTGCGWDNDR